MGFVEVLMARATRVRRITTSFMPLIPSLLLSRFVFPILIPVMSWLVFLPPVTVFSVFMLTAVMLGCALTAVMLGCVLTAVWLGFVMTSVLLGCILTVVMPGSMLLPWLGLVLSSVLSRLVRRPSRVITVSTMASVFIATGRVGGKRLVQFCFTWAERAVRVVLVTLRSLVSTVQAVLVVWAPLLLGYTFKTRLYLRLRVVGFWYVLVLGTMSKIQLSFIKSSFVTDV